MSELKTLPLSNIRTDGGTQTRAALNPDTVRDYAEAYSRGEELPPVIVFYDGTHYWLADGFHRVQAFRDAAILADDAEMAGADAGFDAIAVDIRQGTQRDAILYSVAANATHGLPRSDEDKRRAVIKLLEDDEWSRWSDRKIAEMTRTSHPFVGKLRRDLFGDAVPDARTYERDGDQRTMSTGNISSANAERAQAFTEADIQAAIDDLPRRQVEFLIAVATGEPVVKNAATRIALVNRKLIESGPAGKDWWSTINLTEKGQAVADRLLAAVTESDSDPAPDEVTQRESVEDDIDRKAIILDFLKTGEKTLVEILRHLRDVTGQPFHSYLAAEMTGYVQSGDIVKRGAQGQRQTYALPDTAPTFESVCEAVLHSLRRPGAEMDSEGIRFSINLSLEHADLLTRAIKFHLSTGHLTGRKADDGRSLYTRGELRKTAPPVTPGNVQRAEQAKRDGTSTYNGIPIPAESADPGQDTPENCELCHGAGWYVDPVDGGEVECAHTMRAEGPAPSLKLDEDDARESMRYKPLTANERDIVNDLMGITEFDVKAWWDGAEAIETPAHARLIERGLIQRVYKSSSGSRWLVGFVLTENAGGDHPASRYKQIKKLKLNGDSAVGGVNERLDNIHEHLAGIDSMEFAQFVIQNPRSASLAPVLENSLSLLAQIETELTRLLAIASPAERQRMNAEIAQAAHAAGEAVHAALQPQVDEIQEAQA